MHNAASTIDSSTIRELRKLYIDLTIMHRDVTRMLQKKREEQTDQEVVEQTQTALVVMEGAIERAKRAAHSSLKDEVFAEYAKRVRLLNPDGTDYVPNMPNPAAPRIKPNAASVEDVHYPIPGEFHSSTGPSNG